MKKEILKSKMVLIALSSILFVSCGGGGGGGGGASNLPVNPGTNPGTPSTSTTITSENPLDSRKSNMTQLKSELNRDRENSSATIPTDTGTYNDNSVKVGLLDSDFTDPIRQSQLSARYPGIEFVPRVNSDTSTSTHGVEVLEVLTDTNTARTEGKAKFSVVAASIGNGGANTSDKGVNPNLATYEKVFERFNSSQKVKVINQSFGGDTPVEESSYTPTNIRNFVFSSDSKPFVPYFENKVNNDGALFVWAAGNRIGETSTNPGQNMDSVSVEAGLPYLANDLEKGWIAVVGIQAVETEKYVNPSDGKTYTREKTNGKLNIHRAGTDRLAYAGDNAKYWAISADDRSVATSTGYGVGSSFATPKVSRAAALVAEKFNWMTADQVRQTLFTTTDDTEIEKTMTGENRRRIKLSPDNKYGWGMLNQDRALKGPGAFMDVTKYGDTSTFNANIPAGKTSYFENKIFGTGGLVKSGDGTLHLTNNNSYSGGTVVNAGTLEIHQIHSSKVTVNSGGKVVLNPKALIGYSVSPVSVIGTVDAQNITTNTDLSNRGTVEVNGTTAIIGGDYIAYQGSTTRFNNGAKFNVLGNIKIENATVKLQSDEYVTAQGENKVVMEGKSVDANISNVEVNGMKVASAEVDNNKISVNVSRQNVVDYVGEDASASTKNVAGNVEKVFEDLDNKIEKGIATEKEVLAARTLQTMATSTFTSATEVMSGEIYASAQALTLSQAQDVNRDLSNRFSRIDNLKNSKDDTEVWFSALGGAGKLRRDGYASADTRIVGGQAGIDKRFTPTTTLGLALNYSYAKANFDKYAGESKSDMVGLSLYGKQDLGNDFYLAGRLGVANVSSKVERELLTAIGDRIEGKINHHDKMLSTYLELGKKFNWFTPFIGISQDYLRRGSFDESTATWGIKADKKTYRATNFLVGARAEYVADKYKLHASLSHSINTDKRDLAYEGRFVGSSVAQKYYGVKQAKNTTWIGFGAFREITPAFGVYGNIDFRIESNKGRDSVISTGIQYRF